MLFKVKRFSTKQKLFETEDGNLIEPINGKYKYFKTSNGTYVEGILSELTKKDLKGLTTEKELDAEIGKQLLDEFFQNYKPTNEVNQPKWKMTISKLLGMFSNDYKDKENLDKLFKKITTIENFSEFLSFSTQDFKELTIDDLHKHYKECEKRETACYAYTTLKKEYHFTDQMISSLLPEPKLVKNPYYSSGAPMKLYRRKIVDAVMKTKAYKDRLEVYSKHKESARKGAITKKKHEEERRQLRIAQQAEWHEVLTSMELQDYYANARQMKRHFILHLGPTNSGKTYEALEEFRNTPNSIYLAPLRLLAQEVAEETNNKGVPCTMQTGEERTMVEGATHWSKTIELADLDQQYEVAVIDEGQMVTDIQRGGAWSEAIMGICAKRIHICAPNYARKELVQLIEMCNDTYEVVHHERLTPLNYATNTKKYEKGDALIVFSRRAVYSVAESLRQRKYSVSILYGAMPYEVKKEEARKFREGETDILVSTDCIGMGMNLPIRRVIFLENEKYDGISMRKLKCAEVQQIAGRAGRFGVYPEGYYSGVAGICDIYKRNPSVPSAKVKYPRNIWELNGKLSEILEYWQNHIHYDGYSKQECEELIEKARILEDDFKIDDNQVILKYASIPFDTKYYDLWEYWHYCVSCSLQGEYPDIPGFYSWGIEAFEVYHKMLDVFCHFVADNDKLLDMGLLEKQNVSKNISKEIEKSIRK